MGEKIVIFEQLLLNNLNSIIKWLIIELRLLEKMDLANGYLMKKWPDPGVNVITNGERPSNLWTRAVYYEGLMALNEIKPDEKYLQYAIEWGKAHKWGLRNEYKTRHADNH